MTYQDIKAAMVARIKENGLPFSCKRILEDQEFGVSIKADGSLERHPDADYGPDKGTLGDLNLGTLGIILESQEAADWPLY